MSSNNSFSSHSFFSFLPLLRPLKKPSFHAWMTPKKPVRMGGRQGEEKIKALQVRDSFFSFPKPCMQPSTSSLEKRRKGETNSFSYVRILRRRWRGGDTEENKKCVQNKERYKRP